MMRCYLRFKSLHFALALAIVPFVTSAIFAGDKTGTNPLDVAGKIDRIIGEELAKSKVPLADLSSDEDFLRRITLDLIGTTPSANEVTLFGLNPDSEKRALQIRQLLTQKEFAENWARYWREVIYSRATEDRARRAQNVFETWMTDQLQENTSWDEIATSLVTATGNVQEKGETALMFAHSASAPEVTAEISRIFLGVQIQCANCHDHPTDRWTRDDFHQMAAYFPRMRIGRDPKSTAKRSFYVQSVDNTGKNNRKRLDPEQMMARLDTNDDKMISLEETQGTKLEKIFKRLIARVDKNKDKQLSLEELKAIPQPNSRNRGSSEYYMPDLQNPSSKGTLMEPVFFLNGDQAESGLNDLDRRSEFAKQLTSPDNSWFAKAFVNRVWHEMMGEGFYMPVDDIGPERQASFPEALEVLANGFVANSYNIKWVYETIALTETYQRKIRARDESIESLPFASNSPTRLRSDQLFNSLTKVLGVGSVSSNARGRGRGGNSARSQFARLFGFDPSTPQEDILGNVPQALFMMNSTFINTTIKADRDTRLRRLLEKYENDDDATNELYLMVLAREPSESEINIFKKYRKQVPERNEAYEDLMWSLLNSSEFLSKR